MVLESLKNVFFFKVIKKVNLYLIHLEFAFFQKVWLSIEPIFQVFLIRKKYTNKFIGGSGALIWLSLFWVFGDFDHKYLPRQGVSILPTDRACIPTKIVTQKISRSFWLCSLLGSDLYCIYLLTCARMRYTKATFLIPEFSVT